MSVPVWRLVVDGARRGAENMAVDEAVLALNRAGESPPTVRLYQWRRPTVSLGRFQNSDAVDLGVCAAEGIDVVRRATGGNAVLHDHELTYSIVASTGDGVPRGVRESYRFFARALLATYQELGVAAEFVSRSRGESKTAACYLLHTPADLTFDGRKLSGSAQVWTGDSVLQHGSFVTHADRVMEARLFRLDATQTARLTEEACTIEEVMGHPVGADEIQRAASRAFESALGVAFEHGPLTPGEMQFAAGLVDAAVVRGQDS